MIVFPSVNHICITQSRRGLTDRRWLTKHKIREVARVCGTQRMELAVLLLLVLLLLVQLRHERLFLARQQISLVDVEVLQRLAGQCQIDVQRISAVLPGIR